jgi:hypothetical protein
MNITYKAGDLVWCRGNGDVYLLLEKVRTFCEAYIHDKFCYCMKWLCVRVERTGEINENCKVALDSSSKYNKGYFILLSRTLEK